MRMDVEMAEDSSSPQPEEHGTTTSVAQDSLKNNLALPEEKTPLPLRKRKSWIASLRDSVSRSALQAKAVVDLFRSDHQRVEAYCCP